MRRSYTLPNEPVSEPTPVSELPQQRIRKPRPTDFKLPANFDLARSKASIDAQSTRIMKWTWIFALIPSLPFGMSSVAWTGSISASFTFWLFIYAVLCVPAYAISHNLLDGARLDNARAYGKALEAWEYSCLETGAGFWTDQRGVPFEKSLERLLRARGCDVSMTKATGDGGVDLILSTARGDYWCQCKGQKNPVGVKPIREIAGVCSRNDNLPVVFAVNGYTRPAYEAAQELGVLLYDVADIVKLAALSRISGL